ncbi:MAG TPA: DUF92 domain-containing protein [Terriglobales bacterium]|jgi:uncharacterized protein (TIGR00297 family)|nr:DUF92 domain-containing protein [Terriglobales bacterium]
MPAILLMGAYWLSLASPGDLSPLGRRVALGVGVTLAFALVARLLRAVSWSGAVAGALVTFMVFVGAGPGGFAGVAAVFLLTSLATRFGYRRKQALGTAEKREGRSARQVLANLGVAACAGAALLLRPTPVLLLAMAGALAEAAADTVSGEMGQALEPRAYLITNFHSVAPGTNGGISLSGTMAGCLAAFLVAGTCGVTYVIPLPWIAPVAAAGVLGMMFDSVLGATAERPGALNNDAVNLLGTLLAAGLAALLGSL